VSDVNGNVGAAPQPVSNTAGQPAQTQTPAAPSIDPQEFARLQRIEQQFKGVQPFVEKARSYGFSDTKALDEWGGFAKTASSRGVTPQKLAALFDESGAGEARSAGEAVAITEEMLDRKLSEREAATIRKFHAQKLEEELAAERGEFNDERFKKEFEGVPEEFMKLARHAAHGLYLEKRQPFPEGHPLHGQFGGAGKDGIASIYNDLKGAWKAIETKMKAANLTAIGQAASRTPVNSTVASPSTPQGAPTTHTDMRPGGRPPVAEVEALAEKKRLARAGR